MAEFLAERSNMSHFEYYASKGIDKEVLIEQLPFMTDKVLKRKIQSMIELDR